MLHHDFSLDIITTGGTLEKTYDPIAQTTVINDSTSPIPAYLKNYIQPNFPMNYHPVCDVDSRDMTDEIRLKIAGAIMDSGQHIIITHGTDTMPDTADFLLNNLDKNHGKTIILTGALHPIAFHPSDAPFNLGYAIAQCQALELGIYLCMNAQTFKAGTVKKNTDKGLFESL